MRARGASCALRHSSPPPSSRAAAARAKPQRRALARLAREQAGRARGGCHGARAPDAPPRAGARGGRPRAYAATATGPQRLRDREAARNAGPLRLRDVELAVDSADVSGRRASLAVRSIYGIRGVRGRFAAARRVTAVRTGKGWRVRSETSRRERHPWEVGPVAERRSRHFVVLAPRGLDIDGAPG